MTTLLDNLKDSIVLNKSQKEFLWNALNMGEVYWGEESEWADLDSCIDLEWVLKKNSNPAYLYTLTMPGYGDWDDISQDLAEKVWSLTDSKPESEEMYGFEAMSKTNLESLMKTLSSALKVEGSVGVIQSILEEDLSDDFNDQITFIKNTTGLSNSEMVLSELLQAAETLLDDVQIDF